MPTTSLHRLRVDVADQEAFNDGAQRFVERIGASAQRFVVRYQLVDDQAFSLFGASGQTQMHRDCESLPGVHFFRDTTCPKLLELLENGCFAESFDFFRFVRSHARSLA